MQQNYIMSVLCTRINCDIFSHILVYNSKYWYLIQNPSNIAYKTYLGEYTKYKVQQKSKNRKYMLQSYGSLFCFHLQINNLVLYSMLKIHFILMRIRIRILDLSPVNKMYPDSEPVHEYFFKVPKTNFLNFLFLSASFYCRNFICLSISRKVLMNNDISLVQH